MADLERLHNIDRFNATDPKDGSQKFIDWLKENGVVGDRVYRVMVTAERGHRMSIYVEHSKPVVRTGDIPEMFWGAEISENER